MAVGSNFYPPYQGVNQESPFLKLPGEIRTLIYRAALLSKVPLDLCPDKFVNDPCNDPSLEVRLSKPTYLGPRPRNRGSNTANYVFRDQEDLKYIRKEMAVTFLQTCRQVNREAAMIFWRENTFRFSADFTWVILRRFLVTIGPAARSRLRTVEVVLPGNGHGIVEKLNRNSLDLTTKSHPPLRMSKLPPFERRYGYGCNYEDNVRFVCSTLAMEESLKEVRLVINEGFTLNELPGGYEELPSHYQLAFLQDMQDMHFLQVSLLLEKGAHMTATQNVHLLARYDVDVIAKAGSFVVPQSEHIQLSSATPEEIKELTIWRAKPEPDYITGMEQYFDDSDRFDVPARGGKATKHQGRKKLGRVLKGFGGCRFVHRKGFWCYNCEQEIRDPNANVAKYRAYCGKCKGGMGYYWKDEIEVRKLQRERRRNEEGWN
jgi:hypothetical protein